MKKTMNCENTVKIGFAGLAIPVHINGEKRSIYYDDLPDCVEAKESSKNIAIPLTSFVQNKDSDQVNPEKSECNPQIFYDIW